MAEYKIKKGLLYLLVVLAGILSAIAIYYYHNIYNLQSFMPGVRIAGVPVQGYNMEQAESAVGQRLTELGSVSVTFFKDDYSYQCKLSDLCMPLDAAKIVEDAWNNEKKRKWKAKISSMNGEHIVNYDVPVVYNKEVTDSLIKQWEEKWGVPYQDAKLEVSAARGLIVVPGHPGVKVDAKATFKALPDKLKEDKPWRIPIVTAEVKPEVQDQVLANMGELSRYSTSFRPAEINRSHNLYMAAAAINGKILNPGQVFSFNDQVGKRSQEKGYRDAMVIVNGRFEPGVGGGICQVSSTLYNACLLAGLEIVERHNHNLSVAYVPLGRDATVNYGSLDFKFKNNTDSPVYIGATAGQGLLTINIYGNLNYKRKITISNIVDQTIGFQTVTQNDPQLKPGEEKVDHNGQPGYVVRSFRTFYDSQGKVARTEQLARDNYQPLDKLILKGPAEPVPVDGTKPAETDTQKPASIEPGTEPAGEKTETTTPVVTEQPDPKPLTPETVDNPDQHSETPVDPAAPADHQ